MRCLLPKPLTMKQFDFKKLSLSLIICFVFAVIIISSCRKDAKPQPLADPALNQAKSWYESTYPAAGNTRMLITQSTRPAVNSIFDFTQYIKPDWNHAKKYNRLGKNVIELPIDPSGKISSAIKNQNTGKILNAKERSKSSFILLNDGKNYEAYIMTLLADSIYAKNHSDWALGNTYQKRDPAFSGLVLYFTPQGQYISGYAFKNGQQVIPAAQNASVSTSATQQGQLTRSFRPTTRVEQIYDCTAWYLLEYDLWGNLISQTFLYYTDCVPEPGTAGDPGGGGGSPSTAAPPPPQCQPPAGGAFITKQTLTRVTQPPPGGGDGGMPPPQTCPTDTNVVAQDSSSVMDDNPVKPCALAFKNITSNWMAVAVSGYKLGIESNVFGTKIITFNVQIGMPNYVSVQQAQNATAAAMLVAEATIAQTHGTDFFLSAGAQITYSREFASIVQAQLIAVLGLPGVQVQNAITPGVPIITYANNNCN